MRVVLLSSILLLAGLAMPVDADPGPDACDTQAGNVIEDVTGHCGGSVEPWQCLGGSGSSRSISAGGYTIIINQCRPPPGTGPGS